MNTAYAGATPLDSNGMGKDAFLQLLVTQLRYQDPLKPMENTEFLAQLSQFSSLEQLFNMNETLEKNGDLTLSVHNALMSNLIGREVKIPGNVIAWDGGTDMRVSYGLDSAGEVTVEVYDSAGKAVRTVSMGPQDMGEHTFTWDGLDDTGFPVESGNYRVRVTTPNTDGGKNEWSTYLIGKVTSIRFENGSPVIYVGDQAVNPSDVVGIFEAGS
jgi:flagellar basal-body rod modification protein FlgD